MKKEVLDCFKALPEGHEIHLITGKLEVGKSHSPAQHAASLVETKIAKLGAVDDTETYVPLEPIVK